jgi:hypothetical protein
VDATAGRVPADNESTHVIVATDIDGDGDVDFVLGGINYQSPPRLRLYENDGSGTLRDATSARIPGNPSNCIPTVGDVDDDGDPDILTHGGLGTDRLFLNDGSGRFVEAPGRAPTGTQGFGLVLGDLDGDGDADLVRPSWQWNTTQVLSNVHRQVHVPHLARVGQPWTLDVYAAPGYAAADQLGLPYLSARAAALSMPPFGVLRLDLSSLVALPAMNIPLATGKGSATTMVPNDRRLVGLRVFLQALVVPPSVPTATRLTNASLETVR